jgi:proteasome component ECM29
MVFNIPPIVVCLQESNIYASSLKLPVAALLKQYKEHQNALIRHFDLLYMQQGLERLPPSVCRRLSRYFS